MSPAYRWLCVVSSVQCGRNCASSLPFSIEIQNLFLLPTSPRVSRKGCKNQCMHANVLPEPIGWLYLQLDCSTLVGELFRLVPLKSGTLYRKTLSQLPRCSPSGVTCKRFYYNNLSAFLHFSEPCSGFCFVVALAHCRVHYIDRLWIKNQGPWILEGKAMNCFMW